MAGKQHEHREEQYKTGAWSCANVQCPFYKGETRRVIVCEGFYRRENVRRCLPNEGMKRKVMEELCCGRYETCPWFQLVYGNYDNSGRKRK